MKMAPTDLAIGDRALQKKTIGVGVIGCGKIAQMMHLPFIHELPEFHIAALCDISAELLDVVGERYGVPVRYRDHRDLLADADVEAVVICTYDHGPVLFDTIAAGKHVIVEKPLAFTPQEARELVAAAEAADIVALIGYMKFYDPGYVFAREQLSEIGKPKSIAVHDLAGRMDIYNPLYTLHKAGDLSPEVLGEGQEAAGRRIDAALGPDHAVHRVQYTNLLMLGSHDLAALRGLFGSPENIAYAKAVGPTHIFAVLDYPGGVHATLEVAFGAKYTWWDEWIHIQGETADMRIAFEHPYSRQSPSTVHMRRSREGGVDERTVRFTPDDSFRRQWQHFARCIREGEKPLTPLSDGLADLELAVRIIKALPAGNQSNS